SSPQVIGDRFGLLMDLLEHEMLIAALLDLFEIKRNLLYLFLDLLIVDCFCREGAGSETGDLAVFQIDDVPGVVDKRRRIGGDEILVVPDADQQRASLPGGNN